MATPLVCGPGHIFVGVPVAFYASFRTASVPKTNLNWAGPDFVPLPFDPNDNAQDINLFGGINDVVPEITRAPLDSGQLAGRVSGLILPASKVPVYFGTAEETPEIELNPVLYRWRDDEGTEDDLYEGEVGSVTAAGNRYNALVYEYLIARTHNVGVGGLTGVDLAGALGSSMVYEGSSYPLWVQFPMAAKGIYARQGHPFGYRFFNVYLQGPDKTRPINTDPTVRHCRWVCRRYYDPASGTAATYDHDMRNLPSAD